MKQRIIGSYRKLKETNILANFLNLGSIQISNILLVFLTIRVITGKVGIDEIGIIFFAGRIAQTAGTVINYGTNQSAIRDVAYNLNDTQKLSMVFYNTIWVRAIMFLLCLIALLALNQFNIPNYSYILLAIPMALAEVFNPLCFFIGAERLRVFNALNLVANIVSVVLLIFLIHSPHDSGWVNFILGIVSIITYLGLLIYLCKQLKIPFQLPSKTPLVKIIKDNFYLTVNNFSVTLQQSIIIFALGKWGNNTVLGAYALCDKVIGQCRNLLITISNAVYPSAANLYKESVASWNIYRRKTKYIITGVFFAGSVLIFILADFIICPILSNEHNATAVLFLRIMAFVPAVSALNVLNVLDQLLKNNTVYIFRIAAILLIVSFFATFALLKMGNTLLIGSFTLIIEITALVLYEYVIKKPSLKNE